MARIDRLPGGTKRLLRTAAVLGREAPLPLLTALWKGGDLEGHLSQLKRHAVLDEQADAKYEVALRSVRMIGHSYVGRVDDLIDRTDGSVDVAVGEIRPISGIPVNTIA